MFEDKHLSPNKYCMLASNGRCSIFVCNTAECKTEEDNMELVGGFFDGYYN